MAWHSALRPSRQVHPRPRGVDLEHVPGRLVPAGSPPRDAGTAKCTTWPPTDGTPPARRGGFKPFASERATPASAGRIGQETTSPERRTPRRRRATGGWAWKSSGSIGAPPRARGRHGPPYGIGGRPAEHPRESGADGIADGDALCWRSTPARAGPTVHLDVRAPLHRFTPRERGVDQAGFEPKPSAHEPPPARAGRTHCCSTGLGCLPEHPRVRGANWSPSITELRNIGTPPRARGELLPALQVHKPWRYTPASAGRTCGVGAAVRSRAVHPRVRGANRRPKR